MTNILLIAMKMMIIDHENCESHSHLLIWRIPGEMRPCNGFRVILFSIAVIS